MPATMDEPSKALTEMQGSRNVADDLMSFTSGSVGRPTSQQQSLYPAAMLFIYATWEQFIESLAEEAANAVAREIDAGNVPDRVQDTLKHHDAWALSVYPGWRSLWVAAVRAKATGDSSNPSGSWGMNTASVENVRALFELIGIGDPLPETVAVGTVPEGTGLRRDTHGAVKTAGLLGKLIALRGEVAHTGRLKRGRLKKSHVQWWNTSIAALCSQTDQRVRDEANKLIQG